MSNSGKCPKCGTSELIPKVRVVYRGDSGDMDVKLRIDARPDALIFKEAERSVLSASVCGKCGFTEFFVGEPASLYAAYVESQKQGYTSPTTASST